MTERWLLPDLIFDGSKLQSNCAIQIKNDHVSAIFSADFAPPHAEKISGILAPGLIDLQVNGGGGFLVNTSPSPEALSKIAEAHRRFGTVGIFPTVITDGQSVLDAVVEAALEAYSNSAILGLHIEGPHIAVSRRGTHAERFVRPMEMSTLVHVERLRSAAIPVMVTIAPEAVSLSDIRALAEMGAVVSIGHSDATAGQTRDAIAAGASCATHLFNAMSPMLNRAPGVVGAVINSDIHAGLIVDGYHVADEMIGLALRARPVPDSMFLVSDAMPTVGGPDHFDLYGQVVRLDGGMLVNAEGSLAGAHLTVAQALHRLHTKIGVDRETALRMATSIPAKLMGLTLQSGLLDRPTREIIKLGDDLAFGGFLHED